nr:MAG TPA: hypothetical protein [Caudoviricetes sp.]
MVKQFKSVSCVLFCGVNQSGNWVRLLSVTTEKSVWGRHPRSAP